MYPYGYFYQHACCLVNTCLHYDKLRPILKMPVFIEQRFALQSLTPPPSNLLQKNVSILISPEFEGLGSGDTSGGINGSNTDEDMNDLFRSFLVDGDDILTVSSQGSSHHSGSGGGGSQSAPAPALTDPPPPSGFCLRVGVSAGGGGNGSGGGGGRMAGVLGGFEAEGGFVAARRRANTSPECSEDAGGSSSTQVCVCFFCRCACVSGKDCIFAKNCV